MPDPATRLELVQLVMIPSRDIDRSIEFYGSLGFEVRNEQPWGDGYRWVELYPPHGETGLTLIPPSDDQPVPGPTGVIVHTSAIDATRRALAAQGFDVDETVARDGAGVPISLGAVRLDNPYPPMFWLRDPDGNGLLVIQP